MTGPTPRMGVIVARLSQQREKLERVLAHVLDDEARAQSDAGRWTVAEHVDHLLRVEMAMVQLSRGILGRAEDEEAPPAAPRLSTEDPKAEIVELLAPFSRWANLPMRAPQPVWPDASAPLGEMLAQLRSVRGQLYAVCADAARFDLRGFLHYHYTLGVEIDLYAWLVLHGEHEARHMRHVRALLGDAK